MKLKAVKQKNNKYRMHAEHSTEFCFSIGSSVKFIKMKMILKLPSEYDTFSLIPKKAPYYNTNEESFYMSRLVGNIKIYASNFFSAETRLRHESYIEMERLSKEDPNSMKGFRTIFDLHKSLKTDNEYHDTLYMADSENGIRGFALSLSDVHEMTYDTSPVIIEISSPIENFYEKLFSCELDLDKWVNSIVETYIRRHFSLLAETFYWHFTNEYARYPKENEKHPYYHWDLWIEV